MGPPNGRVPSPIDDYALIGDGRSAALVSKNGSMDWLCWPRFDSDAALWRLLDPEGGFWRLEPTTSYRVERRYEAGTNVLATTFSTADGSARLLDWMPVASERAKREILLPEREILRVVDCTRGSVEVELELSLRPGFGEQRCRIRQPSAQSVQFECGRSAWLLRADRPLNLSGRTVRTRLSLHAGERAALSLTHGEDGPLVHVPFGDRTQQALDRSLAWWRAWSARARYDGPYRDAVIRSVLALKCMTFAPSGAIIAAPTTSLPELLGGPLNWDYRYCWVRDAALTVRALYDLGYDEDASAFVGWLLHATRLTRPEIRVLYDVYGRPPEHERQLAGLAGHQGSRPVRVGNAAISQLQLDSYGELIHASFELARRGAIRMDGEVQRLLRDLGEFVCAHWDEPDHGIWEPRSRPREYTHSKALCWAALDRLLDLNARGLIDRVPRDRFTQHRDRIRDSIERRGYSPRIASYTQAFDDEGADASLLQLAWYGYRRASDPQMLGTYRFIRDRLDAGGGLLYRYEQSRTDGEGAFGICSFWAAEYLAAGGGTAAEAQALLERVLGYANDVGLFAEEMDPITGQALGNFPQAFTHVGLIGAALALEARLKGSDLESHP